MFKVLESPSFLQLEFFLPRAGNAFGLEVARELTRLRLKYKKSTRPLIVRSAHSSLFCSGGNLTDYQKLKGKAAGLRVNREITKHLDGFAAWPVVKLALVEGDAFGGGMEWLARFDYRWSTPYALFGFWQRRIGLSPGWGGGRAWAARIGAERTRALLSEAALLSAEQSVALGLVDRVVSSWKIREAAEAWCAEMHSNSVYKTRGWSVASERRLFETLWHGPEHRAALKRW